MPYGTVAEVFLGLHHQQIQPRLDVDGARFALVVKSDDLGVEPVELSLAHKEPTERSAYERLLGDALHGEQLLFAREDGVESAWRVVDRVLTDHGPALPYARGMWGPTAADALVDDVHGWHEPGAGVGHHGHHWHVNP